MQRIDYTKKSPELLQAMMNLTGRIAKCNVEASIRHLIDIRVSQINGCAFCVDMHVKEAKIAGEREIRIHHLTVWRESPLFNVRERAALELAEAVTKVKDNPEGVSDHVFSKAREAFSEKEVSDLVFVIAAINAWNRLAITFRAVPGSADKAWGLDKAGLD